LAYANIYTKVRLEILTAVTMKFVVLRNVTPCIPVEIYRLFRGNYRVNLASLIIMDATGSSETS
jgi:hypothetical protein